MSRHSKNATATTHFTYHERESAGHGTLKRRFGRDSQLPFGVCCLCLATTHSRSPLVSPGGFIYCKECIYANLLAQKRSIQENLANYERFLESQERRTQDEMIQKERQTLQKALDAAEGVVIATGPEKDQDRTQATQKLMEKVDRATDDEKREAMKRTSFWIPDCTPTQETKVDKPDTKTRDPMSLDEMKVKHLMPVKFEWDTSADGKHRVLCAVTKKEISHHHAVLLRPSGQVILESCLKDMVQPTMTCPVTGLKLRKKDIVHLQAGGTGFSAHSTVEAKKYRPTMT
ncbi:Nitric oxide synthase-interacting protein [Phytophthora palmivora]|uniref:Nitric oxide synthase-interacting protein n=1 Tax=Phytophthora palmivora TaxID=4796 RepID=A0A2P4Y773_9STRA|nr:Nitric oxide synthase-interacting protein [Phytophthora palmivora]